MTEKLLLKGFEVEMFTGNYSGEHVGVATEIVKDLPEFIQEPDCRNLEYITNPESDYSALKLALLKPRLKLRKWLANRELTILPGSTLSLGDSQAFLRSDPKNKYHEFIENEYGANVVTASIHINLGISNLEHLFSALRLIRCEAALLLALSASSPFLDGALTGNHSQRWIQFPLTPKRVPLFKNHPHYVHWVEEQLDHGLMKNKRHLWTSVRPNGSNRPYGLNRVEVRICDLITEFDLLLAITALIELRVLKLVDKPAKFDPLLVSKLTLEELASLCDSNDAEAAKFSLDANLKHWIDGNPISCRKWIEELLEDVKPLAIEMGLLSILQPIYLVLAQGNQAMKWLYAHDQGQSVPLVIQESISDMELQERVEMQTEALLG